MNRRREVLAGEAGTTWEVVGGMAGTEGSCIKSLGIISGFAGSHALPRRPLQLAARILAPAQRLITDLPRTNRLYRGAASVGLIAPRFRLIHGRKSGRRSRGYGLDTQREVSNPTRSVSATMAADKSSRVRSLRVRKSRTPSFLATPTIYHSITGARRSSSVVSGSGELRPAWPGHCRSQEPQSRRKHCHPLRQRSRAADGRIRHGRQGTAAGPERQDPLHHPRLRRRMQVKSSVPAESTAWQRSTNAKVGFGRSDGQKG